MYFEETIDSIIKYEVQVNEEQLKKLRTIIIMRCSKRIQKKVKALPRRIIYSIRHDEHNVDIQETYVGVQEYRDGPDEDIYDVSYVYLEFPKIISYIDQVLKENYTNLSQLLNPVEETSNLEESTKAEELYAEVNSNLSRLTVHTVSDIAKVIDELSRKKQEIEQLMEEEKLNQSRQPVGTYYQDIKGCIQLVKKSEIDQETLQKVKQFYNK